MAWSRLCFSFEKASIPNRKSFRINTYKKTGYGSPYLEGQAQFSGVITTAPGFHEEHLSSHSAHMPCRTRRRYRPDAGLWLPACTEIFHPQPVNGEVSNKFRPVYQVPPPQSSGLLQ